MSKPVTKAVAQEQSERKIETRPSIKRLAGIASVATALAVFAVFVAAVVYAQEKYSSKSPSGVPFSDFRGYEDWSVVSSARTEEVLKVIVGSPDMIRAYKAGVPGNGQPFPEGSRVVKIQWTPKKSTEAPFVVDVPYNAVSLAQPLPRSNVCASCGSRSNIGSPACVKHAKLRAGLMLSE